MALTVNKTGPFYASGPITFSSLRTNFKESASGSVSALELIRNTNVAETNPIVPDATENAAISSTNNLKLSHFRNTIKYYDLDQGSGDTDLNLNIAEATLWNSNLNKNIVKRVNLAGTSGSTNGNPAASLNAPVAYNVYLNISGIIHGTGGNPGGNADTDTNGGDGGDALSISTNGTGTVTVKTISALAQVYGGGGAGGGGGDGGTGGGGQYDENYTETIGTGYSRGGPGGCGCPGGQYCGGRQGNGDPCCGGAQGTPGECFCCFYDVTRTRTITTNGGAGGAGGVGGLGQGYLQAATAGILGSSGFSGGTNAGTGGDGGDGGDGGTWGQAGENGEDGDDGNNGNRTNGLAGDDGTLGGAAGAAVSGQDYVIDITGVDSAYLGPK